MAARVSSSWWVTAVTLLVVVGFCGAAVSNSSGRTDAGGASPGQTVVLPWTAPVRDQTSTTLPTNPSNCSQGSREITLAPASGDMAPALLQAYETLGAEGGGTIFLENGTYQLNETLMLHGYGNVSIQGAGTQLTSLTLPPDPIGNFTTDNGSEVGLFNESLGGPVNGVAGNLIQTAGPIDNLEICDLSLNGEASNASEDWAGSLVVDSGGGIHHVYSDIDLTGLFGPMGSPNGLHIDGYTHPAVGYVIDDLVATDYFWPSGNHTFVAGGPNFLNTGDVTNCTEQNVTGEGDLEYEVAPSVGCTIENVDVSGSMLIDPIYEVSDTGGVALPAGSWGGSLFQNVTVDVDGTGGPDALGISVANGTSDGQSDFSALRWNDDRFVGSVLNGRNMVDVENTTFVGGINSLPAVFVNDSVNWNATQDGREVVNPPVVAYGTPLGGTDSIVAYDSFLFPAGTGKVDPFELAVASDVWDQVRVVIGNETHGYLLSAPNVALVQPSSFSNITYESAGNGSPPDLVLLDIVGSPGFQDLGATVSGLSGIFNDLPDLVPGMPGGLAVLSKTPTELWVLWVPASGPVTNYTLLVRADSGTWAANFSVGVATDASISALTPGAAYEVSIQAWNNSFHSAVSGALIVTMPNYSPGAPTGLVPTGVTPTQIRLEWAPSVGEVTNYSLLMGNSSASLSQATSIGNVTAYEVTGLEPGTTYDFEILAWNSSWASAPSSLVSVTTLLQSPSSPAGPLSAEDWLIVVANLGAVVLAVITVPLVLSRRRSGTRLTKGPPRNPD